MAPLTIRVAVAVPPSWTDCAPPLSVVLTALAPEKTSCWLALYTVVPIAVPVTEAFRRHR